jgi:hypothetical protein
MIDWLPSPDAAIQITAFRSLRTDLKGVEMELCMLQRPDARSRQPLQSWQVWEAMVSEMGGKVVREYNVSGNLRRPLRLGA